MSTIRIARLTNRRELWFDPTDGSPVIRKGAASTGYPVHELKHAIDGWEIREALRKLCERMKSERRGPLQSYPAHKAALTAAVQLNPDVEERSMRYAIEVRS